MCSTFRRSMSLLLMFACWAFVATTSWADVNLEWRQEPGEVSIGDTVRIGIYAVSDSDSSQWISGMEIIFVWDPEYLDFLGNDDTGIPYQWVGFPPRWPDPDGYGLNEAIPPRNGAGLHMAYAGFPPLPQATPEGLLVTTFEFLAMSGTSCGTPLSIVEAGGSPETYSVVWGGMPGQNITGELDSITVTVEPDVCILLGDMNQDGFVNGLDVHLFTRVYIGVEPDPTLAEIADMDQNDVLNDEDLFLFAGPLLYDTYDPNVLRGSGDCNGDGSVNGLDIAVFIDRLFNGFQGDEPLRILFAPDMNKDGEVTFDDLSSFIDVLVN